MGTTCSTASDVFFTFNNHGDKKSQDFDIPKKYIKSDRIR